MLTLIFKGYHYRKIIGGTLTKKSYIRSNKLFTADHKLILYKIGTVDISIQKEVVEQTIKTLTE